MPILQVIEYPDPRLKQVSNPVSFADEANLEAVIQDLFDTMYDAPGCVGLAAPQVGILQRIVVIDSSRNPKFESRHGRVVLINPSVERQEGEVIAREGCLSLPDLTANVKRAQFISVRFQNPEGIEKKIEASDFEARVILHEMDHLDGILFLDRVASLKTDVFRRKRYAQNEGKKEGDGARKPVGEDSLKMQEIESERSSNR